MALGIENLKPTIKILAQLITMSTSLDSNKDGKVDTAEMLGIIQIFVMKLITVYGSLGEAIDELKDVDSNERTEIIKIFNEEFKLDNKVLEEIIEEWLLIADQLITLGSKTANYLKK